MKDWQFIILVVIGVLLFTLLFVTSCVWATHFVNWFDLYLKGYYHV